MTGNAIVLIGVSSVGKTSVSEHLQLALREPYLHVGIDHFFSMFPYEWRGHPRQPGPGLWVDERFDTDGSPRTTIHHGEAGARLLTGMRSAVNALLATDNNVILDEMPIDDSIVPAWRRDLRASRSFWVRLTASLPVLEARERGRTKGQQLGNSRGHFDVQVGDDWDLVVDTDSLSPLETATRIVEALSQADSDDRYAARALGSRDGSHQAKASDGDKP
ncbi:MAG: family ATPase [Marmoricola sp.]|nr:family ATPase [Marmoricola sp.]